MDSIKIEVSNELANILVYRLLKNEIDLQEELIRMEEDAEDFRFMNVRKSIINECISLIDMIKEKI